MRSTVHQTTIKNTKDLATGISLKNRDEVMRFGQVQAVHVPFKIKIYIIHTGIHITVQKINPLGR